jgi:mono/diheme cytochrome c family protein
VRSPLNLFRLEQVFTSVLLATFLCGAPRASAAEATGKISGKVTLEGTLPPAKTTTPTVDAAVCGAKGPIVDEALSGKEGGLQNAVVVLTGDNLPKPTGASRAKVTALGCTFQPHVQSATVGALLEMENQDRVLHNAHAFQKKRTLFNVALPLRGKRVGRALKEAGVVQVRADSGHTWMRAYIVVAPSAFHTVTDEQGNFALNDVPPGEYRLKIWHERLGEREVQVTVAPGQEAKVSSSFQLGSAQADRPSETELLAARFQELEGGLKTELEKTRTGMEQLGVALAKERRARVLADGRPLFLRHCATCHGEQGDGLGVSAQFLSYPPRNFLNGEYQFRMTPSGTLAREEDVFRTVSLGVLGTPMPPWRHSLSYEQRRLLAQYVMALSPRFATEGSGTAIVIPEETPNDEASVARGKAFFEQMQCFQCHGTSGRGDGPSGGTMSDDWGNPIRAWDFTRGYFQGGRGAAVVYRTISTGLSGSPMPSFAEMLEPKDRWDLAHYVLSLGRGSSVLKTLFSDPAGRTQVP